MLDLSSNYIILFKLLMLLILIMCVLINVAFLTLLERNLLGYIQIRKGPNKVSLTGIMQPISDAIKLFTKENIYPIASNFMFYYICPILSLLLSLLIWMVYPWGGGLLNLNLGMLLMISIMSLNVYPILGCGWFSNSKYALLGCLRSIAQAISYEVSLVISLICIVVMSFGFNFVNVTLYQGKVWFIFMMSFLGMLWMVSMLAETNRTPFDFAEGESELVSGYNIEYSGGGFALIFMSEYSSILFMSMLYSLLFFGGYDMLLFIKIIFFSCLFIFIRGLLPRFRYDKLMYVAWKTLLPLSLFMLFMSVNYMFIMWIN